MSLADELLADLEENDEGDLEALVENKTANDLASPDFSAPNNTIIPKEEELKHVTIRELAKLRDSERFQRWPILSNLIGSKSTLEEPGVGLHVLPSDFFIQEKQTLRLKSRRGIVSSLFTRL
ncbi:hypothetical protein EVAR_102815_1 [Eumeta japonica]|uniref:Uncharacterized protein n=1 Tax=Eumeta variegata TaxID=151549 RepID=A0A4C1THY6_EUMVA|nr:hypothetical protein EVAR_102815_1 [Eumeta japonica]